MLSYKLCIGTKGKVKVTLSSQELISCDMANNGCDNSAAIRAWDGYLTNTGIVNDECLPYTSANSVRGDCPFLGETKTCKAGVYKKYKAKDKTVLRTKPVEAIKQSIMEDGPIQAIIEVYKDFVSYKSGIYKRPYRYEYIGAHSVMIIGWGYDSEDVMYWIGVNTWGTTWGDNGYFKMRAGECQIEKGMWTGTANLEEI
jgi:cathepsin B